MIGRGAILSLALASVGLTSARGASLVVEVSAALTNDTGWTVVGKVKTTVDGGLYLGARDAALVSPEVGFAVKSAVVWAHNSSDAVEFPRELGIAPADAAGWDASRGTVHVPDVNADACYTANWDATEGVRRVAIYCAGGDRTSLYLTRIALFGEPLVGAPTGVVVRAGAVAAHFRWQADARVASNRVTVLRVATTPAVWTNETHCGFDDCKASAASLADQAVVFTARHPEFTGETFGFRTDGVMQVGTAAAAGWLGYAGRSRFAGVALRVRARRPAPSDKPTMPVRAWRAGETNFLADVCLADAYAETVVALDDAPDGATIWLNRPCATKTDQRVLIDDLWFYDGYRPAVVATNVVAETVVTGSEAAVEGLRSRTDYLWRVEAYDGDGRVSAPAVGTFRTLARQGRVLNVR